MNPTPLTCLFFNDLEPYEKIFIEPLMEKLSESTSVETVWVTEAQRGFFRRKKLEGDYWIVSRNWRGALDFLAVNSNRAGRIFVSVLGTAREEKGLHGLTLQSFKSPIPKPVTLIAYSPLEFRFLRDIKRIPETQLKMSSLPLPSDWSLDSCLNPNEKFQVGTFCDFSSASNINFLIGVAHFVSKQNTQIHFNVLGRGPLYAHLVKMVNSLGLNQTVSIVETTSPSSIRSLNLFLYAPLRNHHFIPLMLAGAYSVPVVSVDLPGIEAFISEGHTGFIIPSYDIRAMGEKVIKLYLEKALRDSLGGQFNRDLKKNLSLDVVARNYESIFWEREPSTPMEWKQAA